MVSGRLWLFLDAFFLFLCFLVVAASLFLSLFVLLLSRVVPKVLREALKCASPGEGRRGSTLLLVPARVWRIGTWIPFEGSVAFELPLRRPGASGIFKVSLNLSNKSILQRLHLDEILLLHLHLQHFLPLTFLLSNHL